MTKAELQELGGLTAVQSKNSLRGVAEAAVSAQTAAQGARKATGAAQTKGENAGRAVKRFVVGVDPGVKTGFAVWDRESQSLKSVETTTFWELFLGIQRSTLYNTANTCLVIEIANYAPTFRERRSKAGSVSVADRMSRNVGGVSMMADLLVEGFRLLGYEVIERRPIGKVKKNGEYNAGEDRRQFEEQAGWTKQTSQHARDAARLCFQG